MGRDIHTASYIYILKKANDNCPTPLDTALSAMYNCFRKKHFHIEKAVA